MWMAPLRLVAGSGRTMHFADLDHGELDLVRMELNGEQLAK